MFVQVIRGRVTDADGYQRQMDRWRDELMPDSIGFLGSTSGVTSDGRFITVARFESEDLARQNSGGDRQSQWWAETEKMVDDVVFTDLNDVTPWQGGGSDDAGFVQVMIGRVKDVERSKAMDEQMGNDPKYVREDVIGGTAAYNANGDFAQTIYFTSETAARAGEKKMNELMESEPDPAMAEWGQLMDGELIYYDLSDPVFITK